MAQTRPQFNTLIRGLLQKSEEDVLIAPGLSGTDSRITDRRRCYQRKSCWPSYANCAGHEVIDFGAHG